MSGDPSAGFKPLPRLGENLLRRQTRVVDLTREIYQGMPLWPGHQLPFVMVNQTHEEYEEYKERWHCDLGFEAHNWLLSEHTGTHTDAIFEYAANGPTLDDIRLEYYYGSATCLDVSSVRHPEYITEKAPSPCHCVAALHN